MTIEDGTVSKPFRRNPLPLFPSMSIAARCDMYAWHETELDSILTLLVQQPEDSEDLPAVQHSSSADNLREELVRKDELIEAQKLELEDKDAIIAANLQDIQTQGRLIDELRATIRYLSSPPIPTTPSRRENNASISYLSRLETPARPTSSAPSLTRVGASSLHRPPPVTPSRSGERRDTEQPLRIVRAVGMATAQFFRDYGLPLEDHTRVRNIINNFPSQMYEQELTKVFPRGLVAGLLDSIHLDLEEGEEE